jgi:hypothetical protein
MWLAIFKSLWHILETVYETTTRYESTRPKDGPILRSTTMLDSELQQRHAAGNGPALAVGLPMVAALGVRYWPVASSSRAVAWVACVLNVVLDRSRAVRWPRGSLGVGGSQVKFGCEPEPRNGSHGSLTPCESPKGKIQSSRNEAFCTCTRFHRGSARIQWLSWPSADPLPVRTRQSDRCGTSAVRKPHQHR